MLEYTWALVGIVMLPLFGWLIDGLSWRLPFLLMGLLEIVAIFGFSHLPRVIQPGEARPGTQSILAIGRDFFDFGPNWRSALAVLAGDTCTKFSGLVLAINFGSWLAKEYNLGESKRSSNFINRQERDYDPNLVFTRRTRSPGDRGQ